MGEEGGVLSQLGGVFSHAGVAVPTDWEADGLGLEDGERGAEWTSHASRQPGSEKRNV